jgi:uncharacterized protein YndB with AHSA1/START domain
VEKLISLKRTIKAPIQALWQTWTNTDKVNKWFSPEANIQPTQGGAYELFFDPKDHNHMSTIGCKITEIQAPTSLHFQWKGPDQYAAFMNNPPKTSVKVTLTEAEGKTTLTVEHDGWEEGAQWRDAKEWHIGAWEGVLDELENYLKGK